MSSSWLKFVGQLGVSPGGLIVVLTGIAAIHVALRWWAGRRTRLDEPAEAALAWNVRCEIREQLVTYLQAHNPPFLPKVRASLET